LRGGRAFHEERNRLVLGRERRHLQLVLASETQQLAARHQHAKLRSVVKEVCNEGCRRDHVLEVVQDEELRPMVEPVRHRAHLGLPEPERRADGGQYEVGVRDVLQRHEHRVLVVGGALTPERELDREPRLADPARPGERDEPNVVAPE